MKEVTLSSCIDADGPVGIPRNVLIPGHGGHGIVAEEMHVHEVVVHGALHLDGHVVRTVEIHEEVAIARAGAE